MRVTKEKKALVFELWIYLNTKSAKNKNSEIFAYILDPEQYFVDSDKYMKFLDKNHMYAFVCQEYVTAKDKKKFFAFYGINSVNGTHIKRR